MTNSTEDVTVEQCDRKAMVDYECARPIPLNPAFAKDVLAGAHDADTRVLAFARHRLAKCQHAKQPAAFDAVDEFGMTEEDWRWLRWEHRQHMLSMRWRALKALWLKPVVNEWRTRKRRDGVICYRDGRGDDWSWTSAILATLALILDRHHGQKDVDRHLARTGRRYIPSRDMCFWDSVDTYGGYDVMCCELYPGLRISIFSDGECLM